MGAQSWQPAEPRPANGRYSSGSYSSFPGRIPKPPPLNEPNFGPPGTGQSNVPQDTKSFSAVKGNSGTVVIPASSNSYSAFPGKFSPPETSVLSKSFSAVQRNTVPETIPVQPNRYSATETRGGQGGSFSAIASSELAQVSFSKHFLIISSVMVSLTLFWVSQLNTFTYIFRLWGLDNIYRMQKAPVFQSLL